MLFPSVLVSELRRGKDFFYASDLIQMALRHRGLPHPSPSVAGKKNAELITDDGILLGVRLERVRLSELKLEGIKREEDLLLEFMAEEGLDEEFTRELIAKIPELYEPGLLQPPSATNGRAVRYIPLSFQEELKEMWRKRRYYLQNKI